MISYKDDREFQKELNSKWGNPFGYYITNTFKLFTIVLNSYNFKKFDKKDFENKVKEAFNRGIYYRYYFQKDLNLKEDNRIETIIDKNVMSIYEVFSIPSNIILEIVEVSLLIDNDRDIFLSAYSHFSRIGEYDNAKTVLKQYITLADESYVAISLNSDRSSDFIPLFEFMTENKKVKVSKDVFTNYVRSLSMKPKSYTNDLDKEHYLKFLKEFKKEFAKVTSYELNRSTYNKEQDINYFDLIESDMVARGRIFQMKDWISENVFSDLLKKDPNKLRSLVIDYFNKEHLNGKQPKKFTKTYKNIKNVFESQNIPFIDVMNLTVKLQALILMEML